MKYRLFDGGYEGFLDSNVPVEYKDIVIDKLPQNIIDAEIILQQEAREKADYIAVMPDLIKSLEARLGALETAKEITS